MSLPPSEQEKLRTAIGALRFAKGQPSLRTDGRPTGKHLWKVVNDQVAAERIKTYSGPMRQAFEQVKPRYDSEHAEAYTNGVDDDGVLLRRSDRDHVTFQETAGATHTLKGLRRPAPVPGIGRVLAQQHETAETEARAREELSARLARRERVNNFFLAFRRTWG